MEENALKICLSDFSVRVSLCNEGLRLRQGGFFSCAAPEYGPLFSEICGVFFAVGVNAEKYKMKKQFNRMRQLANQTVGR